jgi:DNA polymerase-3 subunit delta
MSAVDTKKIISSIQQGDIKPIYFLMGEEAYFIDAISDFIEDTVLTEEERGFNQTVFYGRDVTIEDIVGSAKRFPMMAERQVIIVKEAQDLSRTIENLVPYVNNLQPSTVLVFCYKYKKLDARKKLAKAIKKVGVVMESKKIYDNQIPKWIDSTLAAQGHSITPKAAVMLSEFLGTDLGKINNELNKLRSVIAKGAQITPELVEENIGISKDYNNFELLKAVGSKNIKKSFAITNYFEQNPKNNPLVVTVATLYGFFVKMLKYHSLSDKQAAAKALGVSPFFIDDYHVAGKNYPMRKVSAIISNLQETDVKSKGVGSNASDGDLLKELLVKIFN